MTRTAAACRNIHTAIIKAAAGVLPNLKVKAPKEINSQGVLDHETRPPSMFGVQFVFVGK